MCYEESRPSSIRVDTLTKQIEELRKRVCELEDKMDLIECRSNLLQSTEERYYSSLGEDE